MSIEKTSLHCQTEHAWKCYKSKSRVTDQSISRFKSGTLNTCSPLPPYFSVDHLGERKQLANNSKVVKIIAAKDVLKSYLEVPKNR